MNKLLLSVLIFLSIFSMNSFSYVGSHYTLYREIGLEGKLDYNIFEQAYTGYLTIQEKKPGVLVIVDYTKPSNIERFFVLDLYSKNILHNTLVSHAKNSGFEIPLKFSNVSNSLQNSLGFYLTDVPYQGKYGYSLKLLGLEDGINSNAENRKVVIHGSRQAEPSHIVDYGYLGRSEGCPAVPLSKAQEIIDEIKFGAVLFICGNDSNYKPNIKRVHKTLEMN